MLYGQMTVTQMTVTQMTVTVTQMARDAGEVSSIIASFAAFDELCITKQSEWAQVPRGINPLNNSTDEINLYFSSRT